MKTVTGMAGGFVYYVSVTGVTGAREAVNTRLEELVQTVRGFTTLPICVGFGIKTPTQVREICGFADGAVVGSALIRTIDQADDPSDAVKTARDFLSRMNNALNPEKG